MNCKILSSEKITDKDFLELMIRHHNMAVKMSNLVLSTSSDDFILDFARKTIFNQSNEVILMENLLVKMPNLQNEKSCSCGNSIITTQLEKMYPNIYANLKCQEDHFDKLTDVHSEHSQSKIVTKNTINHKKNSDQHYVNHMVEHHKSGLDLAKLVIKSTKEPRILVLAQTLIFDQEKELFMIKNLYGCLKYNWRK